MWHPSEGAGDRSNRARSAVVVLVIILAMWWLVSALVDRSESAADKRTCELVAGAGNCVRSGGEWVPAGYSPLFGP